MQTLAAFEQERLCRYAADHDVAAEPTDNGVALYIQWVNTSTRARGVDRVECASFREVRAALGY